MRWGLVPFNPKGGLHPTQDPEVWRRHRKSAGAGKVRLPLAPMVNHRRRILCTSRLVAGEGDLTDQSEGPKWRRLNRGSVLAQRDPLLSESEGSLLRCEL